MERHDHRSRLLSGLPVTERRLQVAGVSTAVLDGGSGPPILLLHGPGEFGGKWMRVIPELAKTHRVIAPDLPGHGASTIPDGHLDADGLMAWVGGLIERTCAEPPVLVGHVLGGAIAARFAAKHSNRLRHLVLVDTLGLVRFFPSLKFALTMIGFLARPSRKSYFRFMRQCSYDLDRLSVEMGAKWEPFVAYNLEMARSPNAKVAGKLMKKSGIPRIPASELARIAVPTTLIWGRHDRANRLRVAERASVQHGWPLYVIENCADDPPRDEPQAFVEALRAAIGETGGRTLDSYAVGSEKRL